MTLYNLFTQQNYNKIKNENPDWKNHEITKELSKQYKQLSQEQLKELKSILKE